MPGGGATLPPVREFAKPTPKLRGRAKLTIACSDSIGPAAVAEGVLPSGADHPTGGSGSVIRATEGDDLMPVAVAPIYAEAEAAASPGVTAADSSSDEDDDYELARFRRRGDLPVKVSAVTGLPSGVASLRRDKITGRVRVLRPSGFHLAHSGTTIAVDDSSVIFLDELSGFERRTGEPRSYMQGWAESGFVLGSLCSPPTPYNASVVSPHLKSTTALAPLISLHPRRTRAVTPPSALRACYPLPVRSLHPPRGCRCRLLLVRGTVELDSQCACGGAIDGVFGCWLFQGALPAPDFVLLEPSCDPLPSRRSGHCRHVVRTSPSSSCARTAAPPGCHTLCSSRQEQLRLPIQRFGVRSSGCGRHSSKFELWRLRVDVHYPSWYAPTLLKNRLFCRHPWARRPRRARSALARGATRRRPANTSMCKGRAHMLCTALAPIAYHF